MTYAIRDDFVVNVAVTYTGKNGDERHDLLRGTRSQVVEALTASVDRLIEYPGENTMTIAPIHPVNVRELT